VKFTDEARLVVPFTSPTLAASSLAVAFLLEPGSPAVTHIEHQGPWWRLADDRETARGRTVMWVRHPKAPPGLTEVVGEVANGQLVNGHALALEAQVRGLGDAQQLLADLLLEARI
jgi:hypothetical protein